MREQPLICIFVILASVFRTGASWAGERSYALVVGNNAPPEGMSLKTLQYADDDAVRYYNFFKRFTSEAHLLTFPDSRTQARYPAASALAELPTSENFDSAVFDLSQRIKHDKANGDETIVYFAFSGHGAFDEDGHAYLSLLSGGLTKEMLFDALSALGAQYTHIFVDACYAEGVVGSKGLFDNESDAEHIMLTADGFQKLLGEKAAIRLPGVGVVMAASEHQKTHEWSQLESGIFTHEVLSGLAGPADINSDGKIEYSELVAFIAAANRDVEEPKGHIQVVAKPPERLNHVAIVDLRNISSSSFLIGDFSIFDQFYIELQNGERYLDAHLGTASQSHIAVPSEQRAYFVTGDREALLSVGADGFIRVVDLKFDRLQYRGRGAIEESFRHGLFRARYSADYYQGFVDSTGFTGVSFNALRMEMRRIHPEDKKEKARRVAAATSFAFAGVGVAAAAVVGALALRESAKFSETDIEKTSLEINRNYRAYTAAFWPLAALVPVGIVTGMLLRHKNKARQGEKTLGRWAPGTGQLLFDIRF